MNTNGNTCNAYEDPSKKKCFGPEIQWPECDKGGPTTTTAAAPTTTAPAPLTTVPASQCTGSSSTALANAQCAAWVEFYDATGGNTTWTRCSGNRLDPCACNPEDFIFVQCSGPHITGM